MAFVLGLLVGAVAGFVGGVLFGRKNKNTVEKVVAEGKADISKVSGGKLNV